MVKKFCPKCCNYSYSAKTQGRWVCPTCGNDLTLKPVLLLEQADRLENQSNSAFIRPSGKL